MRISNHLVSLAATVSILVPAGVMAQPVAVNDETVVLDTIVVTPLRRAGSLARSTSSVIVIDRAEIERSAATDLQSLLTNYNGITVNANGGMGAASSLTIRGMSSMQTVVLINGVRTASATTGATSLANIPLSAIERIEIAKGPHSAQYGADAIGGVVNVITRQGGLCGDKAYCGSVSAGVLYPWGGYTSANLQGRSTDGVDYAIGAALIGTEGYDFTAPDYFGHEPDKDGFLQGSFNLALSKDFDWGKIYADGLLSRSRIRYDNSYPYRNEAYATAFTGKVGTRIDHNEDWSSTVEFSTGLDHSRDFRKGVPGFDRFQTVRTGLLATSTREFETGKVSHSLTGGVEAYREQVNSTTAYDEKARNLAAVYGQYSLEYEALTVDSGVRYDYNQQFGDVVTYNLGASYAILPDLVMRSSFGTGFRAPTFNELYYPYFGNPDLQPEKSRSYEVGLNWKVTEATSLDLAVYQNRLKDAIISVAPTYLPYNIARAKVTGLEVELSHRFNERWSVRGSFEYKQPIDEDTGNDLAYRERVKAAGELSFKALDSLDLTGRLRYGGSRYANASNTEKLDPYVTADLVAVYSFDEQSKLKVSVENLFDKDYQTVSGYVAPGRTINVGLTRNF